MLAHIDADCFFASCEMLRDPSLKSIPIGVGHDICVAKNYLAKSYGIKTGTPRWEAVKLCPEFKMIPVDFVWYNKVSRRMMTLLSDFAPTQEITSIDECFLDLSIYQSDIGAELQHFSASSGGEGPDLSGGGQVGFHVGGDDQEQTKIKFQFWKQLAEKIKNKAASDIGITVSVGIAESKTLAKIASDFRKPNATTVVLPENRDLFLKHTPINAIPGIGRKLTPQMLARNIKTAYDFTQIDLPTMHKWFGKNGSDFWHELQGRSLSPVTSGHKPPKSIIRTASFHRPITDREQAWKSLIGHTERLLAKLQAEQLMSKHISLMIREKDFKTHWFEVELENHTQNYQTIINTIKSLWQQNSGQITYFRSTGVGASHLIPEENYQYSLFENIPQTHRSKRLETAISIITQKYGKSTIHHGV